MRTIIAISCLLLCFNVPGNSQVGQWNDLSTVNSPEARHESGLVTAGSKLFLLGGRGINPVQSISLSDTAWVTHGNTPQELHHFQAVNYHNVIVIATAMTGNYPYETPIDSMWYYNPADDAWFSGHAIPQNRNRGSAGTVNHGGKIYIVGGITNGHLSGWVNWLDSFDPFKGQWTVEQNAPRARDHFHAVVHDNTLYAIGGRRSGSQATVFEGTVPEVDHYDLKSNTWSTLDSANNIPTERAGCTAFSLDSGVVICGGESANQNAAHSECEYLNCHTSSWSTIDTLNNGRHGTQVAQLGNTYYIASGSGGRGGGPELTSVEFFSTDSTNINGVDPIIPGTLRHEICESFDLVQVGDTSVKTITVKNVQGNQAILVNSIVVNDTNTFKIEFSNKLPILIPPDSSFKIKTSLIKSSTILSQSKLIIETRIPSDSLIEIDLVELDSNTIELITSTSSFLCVGDTTVLYLDDSYSSYQWSTGSQDSSVSITSGGEYSVTVLNTNNCKISANININNYSNLGAATSKNSIRCNGLQNGSISLFPHGGTSPYTCVWNNDPNLNDFIIDNLASGTYYYTLTDSVACSITNSITISEPLPIVSLAILNDPVPNSINLLVSGGVNPYIYNWSNGAQTQDLENVVPGTYFVTIVDNNGCAKNQVITY